MSESLQERSLIESSSTENLRRMMIGAAIQDDPEAMTRIMHEVCSRIADNGFYNASVVTPETVDQVLVLSVGSEWLHAKANYEETGGIISRLLDSVQQEGDPQ